MAQKFHQIISGYNFGSTLSIKYLIANLLELRKLDEVYLELSTGLLMMLLENILIHGTIYAILFTLYLLAMMRGLNPRIWAFSDYGKAITDHVPPQTERERRIAAYTGIPFFILVIGFPLVSTILLEGLYGGVIPLLDAFLNSFAILMFGNFADLVILDTLIVGTITPDWVIIPGTEHMRDKEYKDFRLYHAKAHVRGTILTAVFSLLFAAIVVFI